MSDTHVVSNQVPPLQEHNPASSPVLIEALIREGGQWGLDDVTAVGAILRVSAEGGQNTPTERYLKVPKAEGMASEPVTVSLDSAGHSPRLHVQDNETGDDILLSAIELASLCQATSEDRAGWLKVGLYRTDPRDEGE